MKRAIYKVLAGVSLLAAGMLSSAVIAPDGRQYSSIVVEKDAPNSVQLAATELRDFLKQITGDELPVVNEAGEMPVIYVGNQPALAAQGMTPDTLKTEGWAVKTGKDFLAFYGRDYNGPLLFGDRNPWRLVESYNDELKFNAFGESGTLTAVYEFLHRVAGCRFYMPGDIGTIVPKQATFAIPELNVESAPQVTWRWPWFCMLSVNKESALWSKRLGFGGKAPVQIIHSYYRFLKHKDEHPEYFALVDGDKRAFNNECTALSGGHLCLNHPGTIRQWADDIIEFYDANPEVEVYPLSPNDGLNRICECPDCQADLRPDMPEDGQLSYHIWNFSARVAKLVAEKYPDKYVGVLAYEKFRTPPREKIDMRNVAVMYCWERSQSSKPEMREKMHKEINEWGSRVDRVYLWSYYLNHWLSWTNLPVHIPHTIQDDLSWLCSNPQYAGEFLECEGQNMAYNYNRMQTPGMQHLNLYVSGRMFMDPATDVDELMAEYARLFYGPAEKPMLAFWTTCEDRWMEMSKSGKDFMPDQLYTPEIIGQLKQNLADAVASTEEGSLYRQRVEMIKAEFDEGAGRLVRLEATGKKKLQLPIVSGFKDLEDLPGEKFMSKDGLPFSPAAWMFAGRDRQFLYLRFVCYEPDMSQLREEIKENDIGAIWRDDNIEMLFYPKEDDLKHGYQIIINTAGVVFDVKTIGVLEADASWESGIEYAIRKEEKRWMLDVKLPFMSIGIIDPNFCGNILADFFRTRSRESKTEAFTKSSCWSPTGLEAHNMPEKFGIIIP